MTSKKVFLIALFSFVLLIKFYFIVTYFKNNDFSDTAIYNSGDGGHYFKIAKNIHEFHSYSDDGSATPTESATWRPPIWPFTLSLFFFISNKALVLLMSKIIFETLILVSALVYFKKKNKYNIIAFSIFFILLIEPQYLKYSASFLSESYTAVLAFLLVLLFLMLKDSHRFNIYIPIISGITVLCHPVSIFFIVTLLGIYILLNIKVDVKKSLLHILLFIGIVSLWPLRNQITFKKGFYLTASQGATFAKGWNETVLSDFTNVEGDLADESLNLKYINSAKLLNKNKGVLEYSQLYKEGTTNYIKSLSFKEQLKIAIKKLKSNFNPFPEKPKEGFFESLSIVFRIVYLFLFIQLFLRFINRKKFDFNLIQDNAYMVVLAILIGQSLMAVYIYTGFRFNAIYSLPLLLCFIIINENWIIKNLNKYVKQ